MQPSVDDLLLGDLGVVVVPLADRRTLDAQLAVLVNAHRRAFQRQADGADLVADRRVHAGRCAGFGHAVPFKQRQAHAVEEVRDRHVQRGAAGDRVFHAAAEHLHDGGVHELVVHGVLDVQRRRNAVARLLGLGPFTGYHRGVGEDAPLEPASGLLRGGIVDLLEDARHGQDKGGLERAEIGENRLQVAGQAQRDVAGEAEELHIPGEHVRQRQEQQQAAIRLHGDVGHGLHARIRDEHKAAMGQFNPLGHPRGPGGIDDGGQIIATDGALTLIELGIADAAAILPQRFDGAAVDHVDVAEIGAMLAHGFDLVPLGIVFGERHPHLRIVEDHLHLSRRIGFVHRHGQGADGHDGHIQRRPLPARVRDHGDAVPGHDAAGDQPLAQRDHQILELRGGEGPPLALLVLVFNQRILRGAPHALLEDGEQVDVGVDRLLQRPCVFLVHVAP